MTKPDQSSGANPSPLTKASLDKDLTKLVHVEEANRFVSRGLFAPGMALLFLAFAGAFSTIYIGAQPGSIFIVVAAMLGGYMALNIGANDVANNIGPAVGSRALSLAGALVIAAVFESAGALIAGGDVENPTAAIPAPMTPPTTECVVETGAPT